MAHSSRSNGSKLRRESGTSRTSPPAAKTERSADGVYLHNYDSSLYTRKTAARAMGDKTAEIVGGVEV